VRGWGRNTDGQCDTPADLGACSAIAAGYNHTIALQRDGTVRGWGANAYFQSTTPSGLGACLSVTAGSNHTIALRNDGAVRAWGRNNSGQRNTPVGLGPCSSIAAGYGHTIAIECVGRIGAPASPELAPFSFETPRSWIATDIETTSTGATLTIKARGVLGSKAEFLSVRIDGVALATDLFGSESGTTSCARAISVTTVTIPPALFLNLTTDGQLEIRIEPSSNATSEGCATATLMVQLNYTRDIVDCDANGLDDECDIRVAPANRDCNQNLLLDSCEIAAGAADIDMNGRLDSCEVDCNGNGLPDSYEISNNLAPDCNSNALPDSCDVGVGGESNDIDNNGIPDECKSDCNNNTLPDAGKSPMVSCRIATQTPFRIHVTSP
jgi:hypothetical protein